MNVPFAGHSVPGFSRGRGAYPGRGDYAVRSFILLASVGAMACSNAATEPRTQAGTKPNPPDSASTAFGSPSAEQPWAQALLERPGTQSETGLASYYADSLEGRKMASGRLYDPKEFTAAHPSLPFGTVLRVSRTEVHKTSYVVVRDRGPHGKKKRVLDVSKAAARELGLLGPGVAEVKLEVLGHTDL